MTFHQSIVLAGLLGCCSGARADSPAGTTPRPSILPVRQGVEVKEVKGIVEYAYDGTGWRVLAKGKQLQAGATIRASTASAAILQVDSHTTLFKISSATSLHITAEAPIEERFTPVLAIVSSK